MAETSRYDLTRSEIATYIPPKASRVLEVGCATGRFSEVLRDRLPDAELVGVDPDPPVRAHSYDRRIVGRFPDDVELSAYDCVVFNDVLEHQVDPWTMLRDTRGFLSDRGRVVASIPNVRHVKVIRPLLVQGRWDYKDVGILDRTHLRFFTRSTIIELFESSGYEVETIDPMNLTDRGRWGWVHRVTGGALTQFLATQYAVVAR